MDINSDIEGVVEGVNIFFGQQIKCGDAIATLSNFGNSDTSDNSSETINSPFPGRIKKVSVQKGDFVNKGDTVLVIHAFDMDNDILAPKDGCIETMYVYRNSEITCGDVLFRIVYIKK